MDAKSWVLRFISSHARKTVPKDERALLATRYLDAGLIDSMGIVVLITQLEDELGVRLEAEDMQSYEFQTVEGLIGLVAKRMPK